MALTRNIKVNIPTLNPTRTYFELFGSIFKLTERELDVLEMFYRIDPELPARKDARVKVAESLGFKNVKVLNTYVSDFRKRKILIKENSHYRFHPLLQKPIDLQSITFTFISK